MTSQESSSWKQKKNSINIGTANVFPDEILTIFFFSIKFCTIYENNSSVQSHDNNGCMSGGGDDNHDDYDDVDDDTDDVQM